MPIDPLPIDDSAHDIIAAIQSNQVVIIAGDTGCGKTTRIPRYCLDAGLGAKRLIGCTQPRRIAARAMAARVAQEVAAAGGDPATIGCTVRFLDRTTPATRIRFMTDGILLADLQRDRMLRRYDAVILDEIHERSLNIDLLLGALKQLLPRRPDLKLLLSSATMESERFAAFFGNAPLIQIKGKAFPVEVRYRPMESFDLEEGGGHVEAAAMVVGELIQQGETGDALVFMPTEKDILDTVELLQQKTGDRCAILPLYGRLSLAAQQRIFRPTGRMKIVVATNVAETSITVPGIRTVIDSGLARMNIYSLRSRTTTLPVTPISQASCVQRAGRAGRTGPGVCIRLFSRDDFDSRPAYTRPEILRSNLAEVVLKMVAGNMGPPEKFPFLDPPLPRGVTDARALLHELNALTPHGRLTKTGLTMARLPLDPCISRILVEAGRRDALVEAKIIAAALSVQDPRITPPAEAAQARERHARFRQKNSDFLSLVALWNEIRALPSRSALRRFCRESYLSFQRCRDWMDIHDQIGMLLAEMRGFHNNSTPASYEAVHCSILSGFLRFVAMKRPNASKKGDSAPYAGMNNRDLWIFPGSWQKKTSAPWIVASEIVQTSRPFARTIAAIEPQWLEELGAHIMKSSCSGEHWSKKRGQVVAALKKTMFGLPVVNGRLVNFAHISPQNRKKAREIFLRDGLVAGELALPFPFLTENEKLIAGLTQAEERLRARGYVADEQTLFQFYDQRLPAEVYDQTTLTGFLSRKDHARLLVMTEQDVLVKPPPEEDLRGFPAVVTVEGIEIPLRYRFAPGEADDGVTAALTPDLAERLDPSFFEWTVPGLLLDKIFALLKSLPKKQRKQLVPLTKTAALLFEAVRDHAFSGSLVACLAREIQKRFDITVTRDQWNMDSLPPHLSIRFQVEDAGGKVIARAGRMAALLQKIPRQDAGDDMTELQRKWEREGITQWDFHDLPAAIPRDTPTNGFQGFAYPGLVAADDAKSVAIRLFTTEKEAGHHTRRGIVLLYGLCLGRHTLMLRKSCQAMVKSTWNLFSMLDRASRTPEALFTFIMEEMFCCRDGIIPDEETFRGRIAEVKQKKILPLGESMIDQVTATLRQMAACRKELSRFRAMVPASAAVDTRFQSFQALADKWLPTTFLASHSLEQLAHGRRMLQALLVRVERAHSSPAKDLEKEALFLRHAKPPAAVTQEKLSGQTRSALNEYARMVDEYFISLFAQEMGTSFPISAKKLDKKRQEILLL